MLQELAENIWVAAAPQRFLGLQIGTRMTIVRYRSGKLFLHSPVPLTQELRQNLSALGEVGAIVAPNRHHHLHVKGYIERYPQAPVYAAPGLPVLRAFKILLTYGSRLNHITNTMKIEVLLELFSEVRRSSV